MKDAMNNTGCHYDLKDWFYLNRLLIPQILTIIYWIMLAIVVLASLSTLFKVGFFSGLIELIGSVIATRIIFEIIIVIFGINRNLEKLIELQHGVPGRIPGEDEVNGMVVKRRTRVAKRAIRPVKKSDEK